MTADEIRARLKELGLSQTDAARLMGVTDRTVRRWCVDGDVPEPIAHLLDAWSRHPELYKPRASPPQTRGRKL